MTKDLSKLIWPVTAIICSAMIAAGVYFGLRSNQPPAVPRYGAPSAPGYTAPSTAPAVEESHSERPAPNDGGTIVYVTRTGQCYHRAGCSSLSRSKIPMDLSEAKKRYLNRLYQVIVRLMNETSATQFQGSKPLLATMKKKAWTLKQQIEERLAIKG